VPDSAKRRNHIFFALGKKDLPPRFDLVLKAKSDARLTGHGLASQRLYWMIACLGDSLGCEIEAD